MSTIKDVAINAGVSIATVSRVFNNSEIVIEETRNKVLDVAHKLQYTPNALARSLSRKKTDSIGMLLPDLFSEFFSEVIRGVDQVVKLNKFHLFVSSFHNNKDEMESSLNTMRGRVDGLIIMSPDFDYDILSPLLSKNIPVTILNSKIKTSTENKINFISVNNFKGAFEITEHLINHSHKNIGIIKGEDENFESNERFNGFVSALKKNNLTLSEDFIYKGNFTEESGYQAAEKFLKIKNKPSAVFATNDSMAIGFMIKLKEVGIEIPKDVAICGFDDIPISKYFSPKLTTVHVPISEIGFSAASVIFQSLNNFDFKNINSQIDTSLSIRESCGTH